MSDVGTIAATVPEEDSPATSPLRGGRTVPVRVAGPWRLVAGKLLRQKLAMAAGVMVLLLYGVGAFAEFFAPGLPDMARPQYTFAPPQGVSLFVSRPDGTSVFEPHVAGYRTEIDKAALRRIFVPDPSRVVPIGLFVHGAAYRLWGLIPLDIHLILLCHIILA